MTARLTKVVREAIDGRAEFVRRALPGIARTAGALLTRRVKEEIREADAIATGRFHRSVYSTVKATRQQVRLTVQSDVFYAIYVLRGRRPGRMPPVDRIADWIRVRRLFHLNPFLVARAIGRRGIKGRPVFDRAWRKHGNAVREAVRKRLLDAYYLGRA